MTVMFPFPSSFQQTTDADILCGRGLVYAKHPGNIKFNAAIKASLQKYGRATKRMDKSIVVATVVSTLQDETGARFLKLDKRTQQYYEITKNQAHEKTGHAIRDLLKSSKMEADNSPKSSSKKTKKLPKFLTCMDNFMPLPIIKNSSSSSALPLGAVGFEKLQADFPKFFDADESSSFIVDNILDQVLKLSSESDNSLLSSIDDDQLFDMELFASLGEHHHDDHRHHQESRFDNYDISTTISLLLCERQPQQPQVHDTSCYAPLPITCSTSELLPVDSADFYKVCEILSSDDSMNP